MASVRGRSAMGTEVPTNGTGSIGGYLIKNYASQPVIIQEDRLGFYIRSKDGTVSIRVKKKEKGQRGERKGK